MHHKVVYSFLLLLLFITGAFAQAPDSTLNADEIVSAFKLKKKGVFPFGVLPGATAAEIKAAMGTTEVYKEDSSFITYSVYFSNDKYDFGDITYDFMDAKVTGASVEIYFGKKESSLKTLNLLKKNFDKIYKPGTYEDKTLKWKYSKKGINLRIQMSEIEFEGQIGFVVDFYTAPPGN